MRRAPGEAGAKHDMQRTSAPTTAAQSDGGSPAPLVEDTVEGLLLAVQHSRGRQPAGGEVAGSADTATTSALEPCPPPGPAPGRHDAAGDGEGRSMDVEEDDELSAAHVLSGLARMVSQKVAPEKKERKNFSKDTVDELKKWFAEHLDHPYPDEEDKEVLARKTKLNVSQVSYWFVNARKRIWQPLLHEKHAGTLTGYAKVTAADALRGAAAAVKQDKLTAAGGSATVKASAGPVGAGGGVAPASAALTDEADGPKKSAAATPVSASAMTSSAGGVQGATPAAATGPSSAAAALAPAVSAAAAAARGGDATGGEKEDPENEAAAGRDRSAVANSQPDPVLQGAAAALLSGVGVGKGAGAESFKLSLGGLVAGITPPGAPIMASVPGGDSGKTSSEANESARISSVCSAPPTTMMINKTTGTSCSVWSAQSEGNRGGGGDTYCAKCNRHFKTHHALLVHFASSLAHSERQSNAFAKKREREGKEGGGKTAARRDAAQAPESLLDPVARAATHDGGRKKARGVKTAEKAATAIATVALQVDKEDPGLSDRCNGSDRPDAQASGKQGA